MGLLDEPPRGWKRLLARLPIWLYGVRLGWLLGGRFLLLEHTGRTTGRRRRTVLEVVRRDAGTGVVYAVAAWGGRAQWLRNVRVEPRVGVTLGRRRFAAVARELPRPQGEAVLRAYGEAHTIAMRLLGRLFGSADPAVLAQRMRVVELRPAS